MSMHFQLTFINLQKAFQSLQDNPFLSGIEKAPLGRLISFLEKFEENYLHQESMAVHMELEPPNGFAPDRRAVQQKSEDAKRSLEMLLDLQFDYSTLFNSAYRLLARLPGLSVEVNDLVKMLNQAFNIKMPTGLPISNIILANTLSRIINTKLKESKAHGNFLYHPDPATHRKHILLVEAKKHDTVLDYMVESPDYSFTRADFNKLSCEDYELIKKYPISQIFILAGFPITELDAPAMARTIEGTKVLRPQAIQSLIQLAVATKQTLGLDNFRQMLQAIYGNQSNKLSNLELMLNAAKMIGGKAPNTFARFLKSIEKGDDWSMITVELSALYYAALLETNSCIPNQEVFQSYKKPSKDVDHAFMPNPKWLEDSIKNFEAVDKISMHLIGCIEPELKLKLETAVSNHKSAASLDKKKMYEPMIWAVLRELFRRTTQGKFLTSSQMINMHLMLNNPDQKTIAQIKLGEGSHDLHAVMMAYRALTTEKQQFNVTINVEIAERRLSEYMLFYKTLELACTSNISSKQGGGTLYANPKQYSAQIVYGTAESFLYAYMLAVDPTAAAEDIRKIQPQNTDLFIEELDALLSERHQPSTKFTKSPPPAYQYDNTGVYFAVWQYIFLHRALADKPATYTLEGLRAELISKRYFTKETLTDRENMYLTQNWFIAAQKALKTIAGTDYIVELHPQRPGGRVITIIERNGASTTVRRDKSFENGLLQIICAREGILVPAERGVILSPPYSSFFKLFGSLFVTSSMRGGAPFVEFLRQMYPGVGIMTMPCYRGASKAISMDSLISDNTQSKFDLLIADIAKAIQYGQSLLFLFETIQEMQAFRAYASSKGYANIVMQDATRSSMTCVGLPQKVMLATFNAVPSIEIKPTPESEANGGLGVYVCNLPKTRQVIEQCFDLTGQQGRGGFFAFRLSREELLTKMNDLERGTLLNDELGGPDCAQMDSFEDQWQTPVQPQVVNITTSTDRRPQASMETSDEVSHLLKKWDMYEAAVNRANVNYARYINLVCALQNLAYHASGHLPTPHHFIWNFYKTCHIILADLAVAFQKRNYPAFEKAIEITLLELCNRCSLSDNFLKEVAEKTGNQIMIDFFQHVKMTSPEVSETPNPSALAAAARFSMFPLSRAEGAQQNTVVSSDLAAAARFLMFPPSRAEGAQQNSDLPTDMSDFSFQGDLNYDGHSTS